MKIKGTLTRAVVLEASRKLKAEGLKLPKQATCVRFKTPFVDKYGVRRPEICRDRHGYYLVGFK